MPKSERNPKSEIQESAFAAMFGLRVSFGFRVSGFGFAEGATLQQALTD
jgi:hypothetical protein